jgi:hypothetical protein
MAHMQMAVALYPKAGFLAKTDRRSDTMPHAGRIRMYTSG